MFGQGLGRSSDSAGGGGAVDRDAHVYLVGGGIASLAAAAFLIRDGDVLGHRIIILEELNRLGGSVATILAHDARGAVGELSRLTAHAALSNKSAMTTAWPRISWPSIFRSCPFLIIAIASKPAKVRRAVWKLPKPSPGRTRRLIRRWSCSTMLLRYLHCRRQVRRDS